MNIDTTWTIWQYSMLMLIIVNCCAAGGDHNWHSVIGWALAAFLVSYLIGIGGLK